MKQVLIADDLAIVRFGASKLLQEQFPGLTISYAATANELFEKLEQNKFDLLILSTNLEQAKFPETLNTIKQKQPDIRILVLSGNLKKKDAALYIVAGANGILFHSESERKLKDAIVCIFNDASYLSNGLPPFK